MADIRLFHFSDDPSIEVFTPRSVQVPAQRPPGMEWLNGPLVWAIEESHQPMYLFPRDCPRILIWATPESSGSDKEAWLGTSETVAYIERHCLDELDSTTLYRYEFPSNSFENLQDAGMWVSRETVTPIRRDTITNLRDQLVNLGVDLRVVESLVPFRELWETSLHVSGIRLRNARGWSDS